MAGKTLKIAIKAKVISARAYANNWHIVKCRQGESDFTAVGLLLLDGLSLEGLFVNMVGHWDSHPVHGKQFKFESVVPEGSELFFFLSRVVKGIGEKLAQSLISEIGEEELVRILDESPETLLSAKGIGPQKLQTITESWKSFRPVKALSDYLSPYGVTPNLVMRIFNHFGENALKLIRENVFRMTQVSGIGFKKADDVALKLGVQPHDPYRICACIKYVLSSLADDKGDTLASPQEVIEKAVVELKCEAGEVSSGEVGEQISAMIGFGQLVELGDSIALPNHYDNEQAVLNILKQRLTAPVIPLFPPDFVESHISAMEKEMGFEFNEDQKNAIRLVGQGHRTILVTGYAGSGKTSCSRAILGLLAKKLPTSDICCMALSGIASDRVRKSSGYDSATIHTSLGWNGGDFSYGADNPLPHRAVLLDEASMVNSSLFRRVLESVDRDSYCLLLGDPAQLPPIGAGAVFANLVESRFLPMIELTKIYRQSANSVLTLFANEIRQGVVPEGYLEKGYRDFEFVDISLPRNYFKQTDEVKAQMREENHNEILQYIEEKIRSVSGYIKDKIGDFQAISPMRSTPLGTESLNKLIQGILNPDKCDGMAIAFNDVTFRPGDKVVHLQNKDLKVKDARLYADKGWMGDQSDKRVYNGNIGMIVDVNPESVEIFVEYPEGFVVRYDSVLLGGGILGHAFSLTCHKLQGSQSRLTLIPITSSHTIMLTSQLLYTALTRAQQKCLVVGQRYAFERACKSLVKTKRKTVLERLLAAGNE